MAADNPTIKLAQLRVTFDHGVLTECAVMLDGEEVAQLAVHNIKLEAPGMGIAQYHVSLHADWVRTRALEDEEHRPTVIPPQCPATSKSGKGCSYEADHGDPHEFQSPRAPGYERLDRSKFPSAPRVRHG